MNMFQLLKATALLAVVLVFNCSNAIADGGNSRFAPGKAAPAFKAKTVQGKDVSFPTDYKGKIVLLDFWATWCPPCREEIPNLVATYEKYHAKGFEVLGVSLDRPQDAQKIVPFLKANKMVWPEIYDAKYWQAAVAVLYGIESIPQPILVDGTTGIVLAEGDALRGTSLGSTIEKALAPKKKK